MSKWKSFVENTQAKTFVLPEGWDSRDEVAEQLGCGPDNVRKLMAPAIKAGTVETKQFPVWDKITKKVRAVTAYRQTGKK